MFVIEDKNYVLTTNRKLMLSGKMNHYLNIIPRPYNVLP